MQLLASNRCLCYELYCEWDISKTRVDNNKRSRTTLKVHNAVAFRSAGTEVWGKGRGKPYHRRYAGSYICA
ncbi:unnamed protein product [Leptidea sinapis]|uniref:Uncharacterized protein n=1 Tax=Leptidea sinapis TaxID=189913 RepID=A0A5E4QTL2_9NEOP|nr:unnamed protein product [Leptidea sinapis]